MEHWWNDTDRGNWSMEHWWNDIDRGNWSMEHWWNDTDKGNWSTERKTYSFGGRWMNEYGVLVE